MASYARTGHLRCSQRPRASAGFSPASGWRHVFALFLFLPAAVSPATARAGLTARAVVDRTRVTLQDVVQLTVVVSGGEAAVDTAPIRDFQVTSRGQSSSVQIVNTRVSRETRFQYALSPLRAGTLVVPALTVRSGGDEAITDPISILVTDAPAATDDTRDVALRAEVSNATPFLGEELVYTLRVEAAVPIFDASYREPELKGFLVRKLDGQRTGTAVRNGREVRVTEITYLLTPREVGKLTIGPATLSCQVPAPGEPGRRRDPFNPLDDPFFRRQRVAERVVRSPEVSLEVWPLPPAPAGTAFSGLVGDFTLSAALTPPAVAAGDSATLTVVLEGRGNVEEASAPEVELPPGFKIYPDNPETDVKPTAAGTAGTKRFRFALVPTVTGDYQLGPFRLGAFDTKSGSYRTLQAGPFPLRVTPGTGPATPSPGASDVPLLQPKLRVEQRGEDILDIHRDLAAVEPLRVLGLPALLAAFGLPPVCYLLVRLATAARRRERTVGERMRERARQLLVEAAAARTGGEWGEGLGRLHRAVTAAALARARREGEILTYEEAQTLLRAAGADPALCRETAEVLQSLDAARYGDEVAEPRIRELIQRCEDLVKTLGRGGREP